MTDKQGKEQQSYKSDASNVDLQDQYHSTGFGHAETTNFDENNEPVDTEKYSTCTLSLEEGFNENEISNTVSRLTHIHTLVLIGKDQKVNLNAVTSLQNQIQTCIVVNVQLTLKWNVESNAMYAMTNLRHLELINCEIIELHDAISKLTSLQTFLVWNSPKFSRLPFPMSNLTSLRCLSLTATNINVNDAILVVTKLSSLQMLKMSAIGDPTQSEISHFMPLQVSDIIGRPITSLPTQIGHLTALQQLDLSDNQLTVLPTQIDHLTTLQRLYLSSNQLTLLPTQIGHLTTLQQLYLLLSHGLFFIPSELGMLSSLKVLNFEDTDVTFLPPIPLQQLFPNRSLKFPPSYTNEDYAEFVEVYNDLY
jgi:Leucine-rich repeat (LRR) protein